MCFSFILNILRDLPGIKEAIAPRKHAIIQMSFLGINLPRKTKSFASGSCNECLNRRNGRRDVITGLFHSCLEGIMKVEYTDRNSIAVNNYQRGYS